MIEIPSRIELFVDRDSEMQSFRAFLESDAKPIMLVLGDTGLGKTCLLARMLHECSKRNIHKIEIDTETAWNLGYTEIMCKIRDQVGPEHFQAFMNLLNFYSPPQYNKIPLQNAAKISIAEHAKVGGDVSIGTVIGTQIICPSTPPGIPESQRMRELTTVFIKCLQEVTMNDFWVLFIDPIENLTDETKNWIYSELLRPLREGKMKNFHCVLTGMMKPDFDREMSTLVKEAELAPLNIDDIKTYLEKRQVKEEERAVLAKSLWVSSKGKPDKIAIHVDAYLELPENKEATGDG